MRPFSLASQVLGTQNNSGGSGSGLGHGKEKDNSPLAFEIWKTYPTNKHRQDELQIPHADNLGRAMRLAPLLGATLADWIASYRGDSLNACIVSA